MFGTTSGGLDRTVGLVIGIFSWWPYAAACSLGGLPTARGATSLPHRAFQLHTRRLRVPVAVGHRRNLLGRVLQGVGEACLYTGAAAWAVEVAGVHRSARALGYLSSGIWGGIAAGPLIGQLLGSFNNAARFQIVAAISAAALLTQVPEDYQPADHVRRRGWLRRSLVPAGIAVGFVNVHYPVITGFLILYLARHGNSGPAAFSTYAGFVLLSRFFLGGLPDRIHPRITFYTGLGFMALGLGILAIGPAWAGAVIGAGLLGFGFSFPWASVASTVLRATPDGERGSAVSVLQRLLRSVCRYQRVFRGVYRQHLRVCGHLPDGDRSRGRRSGCGPICFRRSGASLDSFHRVGTGDGRRLTSFQGPNRDRSYSLE